MRQTPDYCGASGNIRIEDVAKLSSTRYRVQPKIDGAYCAVRLDHAGRVAQITSRTGADYGRVADSFRGILLGLPGSVLVGEIEAHTEAGTRAAEHRGWPNIHLFDAIRIGDRILTEPYRVRRDLLYRMHSELANPEHFDGVWNNLRRSYRGQDGRYQKVPMDWRRFEIVPQYVPSEACSQWDIVKSGDLEGLVIVDLDAPLGRRRAKRKCKLIEHLDGVVVATQKKTATVRSFGCTFNVSRLKAEVGQAVEVAYNGRYADGTPRFARVVRVRTDLWA